jgi:hypothetical protein
MRRLREPIQLRIVAFMAPDSSFGATRFEHRNPTPARDSALVQEGS